MPSVSCIDGHGTGAQRRFHVGDATGRGSTAGRPAVDTGAVFAVLSEVDHGASWGRLWLETGDPHVLRLHDSPDSGEPSGSRWSGIAVTPDLAAALSLLEVMRRTYGIDAVTPGLMAVALVADPTSGAARRLTAGGLTHGALLDLVQSEVFGSTLENLPAVIDGHRREDAAAPPGRPGGEPPW